MNLEYEWHDSEQEQATSEGWAIWNYPEAPEIQRLDEEAIFTDDHTLIQHLTARAFRGDPLACKALVLHWGANAWTMRQGTGHEARGTTFSPANQAQEVVEFIRALLNGDENNAHDLLVNYGEEIETKAELVANVLEQGTPNEARSTSHRVPDPEEVMTWRTDGNEQGTPNDVPRTSDVEPPRWIKRYVATVQLVLTPDDALDSEAVACDAISAALTENLESNGVIEDWAYLRVGGQYMGPSLETVRNLQHPDFEDTPASMLIYNMDY